MSASSGIRVTFEPSGRTVTVPVGTTVLDAAALAGLPLRAPCGGEGTCGKCLVRLRSGLPVDKPPAPDAFLDATRIADGWRRACRTRLGMDAVVEVPASSLQEDARQILTADAGGVPSAPPADPAVEVLDLEIAPPTREDDRPDAVRIAAAAGRPLRFPRALLATLPAIARASLRDAAWHLRVAAVGDEAVALLPAAAGDASRVLGVAFDLGTTTVVGTLVDLESGAELGVASALNAQIPFGDDVLARILRVRERPGGLRELRAAALDTLNGILATLLPGTSANVAAIALAGNTTMQQLCCGIDPSALGEIPFAPAFSAPLEGHAGDFGFNVNPAAHVFVFPQVGGFVGGDTVACLLACDFDRRDKPTLMVDIGTNGEIALRCADGSILCASTAAGPAFEGARISQGMRAASGAISKVEVRDGALAIEVIGGVPPAGLCGTALIDTVAELLRHGILDETGRILEASELPDDLPGDLRSRVVGEGTDTRFLLVHGNADGTGEVALRQRDIRELQLASGALRAGVETLLSHAGISRDDLDAVLLAGAFGNYIRRENACRIGLLPPIPVERIRFVGNAASLGAKQVLRSRGDRARATALGSRAGHVDLGTDPGFQTAFGMAMLFPSEA